MGSVRQNARENLKLGEQTPRLHSTVIGQVCLDPENFARYNDAIIQASILRCALPHELDFRSNLEASQHVTKFLLRMFRNLRDINSEGLLEFLSALATRRLQVDEASLSDFSEKAFKAMESIADSPQTVAIRYFLCALRYECLTQYAIEAKTMQNPF
jgi:hypothetical protein